MKNLVLAAGLIVSSHFTGHSQQGHVVSYDESDGLGRPEVTAIYYDSRDVLWVGTAGSGLYQFQQARFIQPFTSQEVTGFMIKQLGEDAQKNLCILSEKGLFRFDGHWITMLSESEDITSFVTTASGLWYATSDSLFYQRNDGKKLKAAISAEIIMPSSNGVFSISDDQWVELNENMQQLQTLTLPETPDDRWIRSAYAGDSSIWIASEKGLLLHLDELRYSTVSAPSDITDIASGAMGSLLVAGGRGASIYQPIDSTWIDLPVQGSIRCLYFDRQNRLWLGSSTDGLLRYFGEQHQVWSSPENAIASKLHAGTSTETTIVQSDGTAYRLGNTEEVMRAPVSDGSLQEMHQDALSRLWALTSRALWMLGDTGWIMMDSSVVVQGSRFAGSDKSGNLWISKDQVLMRYGIEMRTAPAGVSFQMHRVTGTIPQDELVAVLAGQTGTSIRIGKRSIGSIVQDRYEQAHHFTYDILAADLDSMGRLWLGTRGLGIFLLHPQRGSTPRPLKTTYPIRAYDILFIRHMPHSVIAGTDRNILRFFTDTSEVNVTKVDVLNEEAGIPIYDRTAEHYAMTADGSMLFIAGDDVVEFDLSRTDRMDHVPTIFLQRILVNGVDIYETRYRPFTGSFGSQIKPITFLPSERSIAFTFSGNSVEDEHLFYSWRLSGLEEAWSAPSALNEVQFTDLDPGEYAFEVRVCDDGGNCSELRSPWKFTIGKPLFAKVWFWAAVGIVLLISGVLIYRQRSRRLRKSELSEKKRLEAELNALTLEQKSLQLQMNPHFIFNTLQALRSHIREDKLDEAKTNLTRFAKLIRAMLDVNRSEKITLEDELEFLQAYVDVESITMHSPLNFTLDVDEDIESYAVQIPPMLIQPVLENAIKYGGDGNEVRVSMQVKLFHNILHVIIQDNGSGFGSHTPVHKSAALDILKNRLMRMGEGGGLEIGGGAKGARVVVKIPLEEGEREVRE